MDIVSSYTGAGPFETTCGRCGILASSARCPDPEGHGAAILRPGQAASWQATFLPDSLDAAFAEAMAALPNGNAMRDHRLYKYGSWRMQLVGPWDIEHDGHRPTWQAIAQPYNATGKGDDSDIEALGPTPAAALRALAATLRDAT